MVVDVVVDGFSPNPSTSTATATSHAPTRRGWHAGPAGAAICLVLEGETERGLTMVEFGSLLLGIVVGVRSVTLLVTPPTERVQVFLDGRPLVELRAEPWQTDVDLGPEPMPHELEAVGYNHAGRITARAHQLVNLPRPSSEASGVLEWAPGTPSPSALLLSWNASRIARPPTVTAWLDGQELPVSDSRRVQLPPVDARTPHLVLATVAFMGGSPARVELAFGGDLQGQAASELTAVPIEPSKGAQLSPAALAGRITREGLPLSVVGVERGPSDVIVVVDWEATKTVTRPETLRVGAFDRLKAPLPGEDALTVLSPGPGYYRGSERVHASHAASEPIRPAKLLATGRGLATLAQIAPPPHGQKLASAVALAGVQAMARGRRRAVVLVLAEGPTLDPSVSPCGTWSYSPAAARRFLEALRVPLHVWSMTGPAPGPCTAEWGPVEDVSSRALLETANRRLQEALDRQRVVWLAGRHLPQQIVVADDLGLSGHPSTR